MLLISCDRNRLSSTFEFIGPGSCLRPHSYWSPSTNMSTIIFPRCGAKLKDGLKTKYIAVPAAYAFGYASSASSASEADRLQLLRERILEFLDQRLLVIVWSGVQITPDRLPPPYPVAAPTEHVQLGSGRASRRCCQAKTGEAGNPSIKDLWQEHAELSQP